MSRDPNPRGLVARPVLSVLIFLIWVLLKGNVSAATLLTAIALAVGLPVLTHRFRPDGPLIRRPARLLAFLPVFLWDVLVANLQVAWLIVNVGRTLRPRWLVVPLEIRDPMAITTLANVISLTPGTVSSEVGPDFRTLLVHSLDEGDEAEAIAFIKRRYEKPIGEIFE